MVNPPMRKHRLKIRRAGTPMASISGDAWKMPMNIAKEKAFTGYTVTAPEGYRFGLCNRCVHVEELEECTMTLAKRMLKLTTYTLITKHNISSATIDRLRKNQPITTTTMNDLCRILNCDVKDIAVYVSSDQDQCL